MFKGHIAESNNGWEGYGPWKYTVLDESELQIHLERLSFVHTEGATEILSFQPWPEPGKNQDRYVVDQWNDAHSRSWKLYSIFDGHAGHETVDYTVLNLLPIIKHDISVFTEKICDIPEPHQITDLLRAAIVGFDDNLTKGLLDLFPDTQLAGLTDEDIRAKVIVDGQIHPSILPCLAGTTALIAILDPIRNLYVVSLGDCTAVLGKHNSEGKWDTSILSGLHNGADSSEATRLRDEHPGEDEVVCRDRVLGAIAVTRAIGDQIFKVPLDYAERVFQVAHPSAYILGRVEIFKARHLTPPYLSNVPHITHVSLKETVTESPILILASDGLTEWYDAYATFNKTAETWVEIASHAERPALSILRQGMGGDNVEKVSFGLTAELDQPYFDDTTIIVTRL